jgi:hypothetical protein
MVKVRLEDGQDSVTVFCLWRSTKGRVQFQRASIQPLSAHSATGLTHMIHKVYLL